MTDMSDSEALDHYRIETARLRQTFTTWAENVDPTLGYSGRHIADMVTKILAGQLMMDLDLIKARLGLAGANFPTHLAHALVAEVERLRSRHEEVLTALNEALLWTDSGGECASHIDDAIRLLP